MTNCRIGVKLINKVAINAQMVVRGPKINAQMVARGPKGVKGDTGIGLEYDWDDTNLGVKKEDEVDFEYVNLKGEKGDPFVYEDFTQEQISDLKSNLETAVNEAHNFDNGKTYRWGLKIVNGKTQFMYEEVVE